MLFVTLLRGDGAARVIPPSRQRLCRQQIVSCNSDLQASPCRLPANPLRDYSMACLPFSVSLCGFPTARCSECYDHFLVVPLACNKGFYFLSFKRSRISVRSFSSADGSGSAAGAAGCSSFFFDRLLMPLTRRNTHNAMITKSMIVCMKLP